MDVDEFDVDRGDLLSCPLCGTNLEVLRIAPVELDVVGEGDTLARGMGSGSAPPDDGDEGSIDRNRRNR